MAISKTSSYQEIRGATGRVFRVGEDPKEILGRSRSYMVYLPWVAMMAAGIYEYAYGSAVDTLQSAYGWSDTTTFMFSAIWGLFQAGIALPAGQLREKNIVSARTAMLFGALFCGLGLITLGNTSNIALNVIGFGLIGGTGAGLVYATCINMVGKWYPEKKGARTGFVNGGFAYGSIPFIVVFNYWFTVGDHSWVLDLIGVLVIVVIGACAVFFKDPPKNWWPDEVDPTNWESNAGTAKRNLQKNPPAQKQFTWGEAMRRWQMYALWGALVLTSGVSFFGISFESHYAKDLGWAAFVATVSAVLLALVNGVGRAIVGWASDLIGRKQTLVLICVILGLAQWGTVWAGSMHNEPLFFLFAIISGFGGGAFYPMFAMMTPDYFGENYNASNYGTVYSGKLVGVFFAPLGAAFVTAEGYTATYILAGAIGLVSGLFVLILRQPKAGVVDTASVPAQTAAASSDAAEVPAQTASADDPASSSVTSEE